MQLQEDRQGIVLEVNERLRIALVVTQGEHRAWEPWSMLLPWPTGKFRTRSKERWAKWEEQRRKRWQPGEEDLETTSDIPPGCAAAGQSARAHSGPIPG